MAEKAVSLSNLEHFKAKQDSYNDGKFAKKAEIPANLSQLNNDSGYQTEAQVQSAIGNAVSTVFTWKGSVETESALPSSDNKTGDVWHVNENGGEYAWSGTAWEQLGNSSGVSVEWSAITGKPATFTPSEHTHEVEDITDFPESMPASDVYAWAKAATKPTYTASEVGAAEATHTHDAATTSAAGFMSAADKSKLDGLENVEFLTEDDIDALF